MGVIVKIVFFLFVFIECKCPRCDKAFSSYEGLRKHAGLSHHLSRENHRWVQLRGEQADALVTRLQAQSAHHSSFPLFKHSSKPVPTFPPPVISADEDQGLRASLSSGKTAPAVSAQDRAVSGSSSSAILPPSSFGTTSMTNLAPQVPFVIWALSPRSCRRSCCLQKTTLYCQCREPDRSRSVKMNQFPQFRPPLTYRLLA